jgi:hypothetical protein
MDYAVRAIWLWICLTLGMGSLIFLCHWLAVLWQSALKSRMGDYLLPPDVLRKLRSAGFP